MKIIKQEYHCTTRIHTSPITQTRPNNTKPSNLTPLTRSLSTVKKVAMDAVGRILMLRISIPSRGSISLKLGRRYWNSRRGFLHLRRRECRGHKLHRENYSLISHARNFPPRIFPPSYDTSAACFRLRGIIQIWTARSQRIYRRELSPV